MRSESRTEDHKVDEFGPAHVRNIGEIAICLNHRLAESMLCIIESRGYAERDIIPREKIADRLMQAEAAFSDMKYLTRCIIVLSRIITSTIDT